MGYASGEYRTRIRFGGRLTPAVKALLIANGAVFAVQVALHVASPATAEGFLDLFSLTPALAIGRLRLWQFITYSFLHEVRGALPFHLLFNMFMLWVFGGDVERTLGRPRFLKLYFGAALAGGLCMIPMYRGSVLGASGAVFGVMAMVGRLFPHRRLLIWGIVPVRARTLILVLAAVEMLLLVASGGASNIAHLAHLGGFAVGWFFLSLERAGQGAQQVRRIKQERREERGDAEVRRRVDELLKKVGREGLGKLTPSERRFLKRSSERFRR